MMAPRGVMDALSHLRLSKLQRWVLFIMTADLSWHKVSELQGDVAKVTLKCLAKRGLVEIDYTILPNDIAYRVTQRGCEALKKIDESEVI